MITDVRINVLLLALLGCILCGVMSIWLDKSDLAIITGGLVGGLITIASKLVDPAPAPTVPATIVEKLIEGRAIPIEAAALQTLELSDPDKEKA